MLLLNIQKSNNGRKCSWLNLKKMKVDKKHLERELLEKEKLKLNNDESEN
jgi:hypothetical protein